MNAQQQVIPHGLPRTTNMLIFAELHPSVATVTVPTLQHERDMPPIVTAALLQDQHQSASTIVRKQPVSTSAKHCIPLM